MLTNIELEVLGTMWPAREMTRTTLERSLDRSRPTIDKALRSLQDQELIALEGRSLPLRGRPAETFQIRSDAWSSLGIDFEMPNVDVVLADALGRPIATTRFSTSRDAEDSREILEETTAAVHAWLDGLPHPVGRLSMMGVGVPGYLLDGALSLAGLNMPVWRHVPIRSHLERSFAVPVLVSHGVHFMALAEIEHREWTDAVVLYCTLRPGLQGGIRIGACLSVRGRPYRGAHGNGGALYRAVVPPEEVRDVPDAVRIERIADKVVSSLVHLVPMADPDHIVFQCGEFGSLERHIVQRCETLLSKALQGEFLGVTEITAAVVRGASGAQCAAVAAIRELLTQRRSGEEVEKGGLREDTAGESPIPRSHEEDK